ncbi:alpha-1,2-fucosyltransferase [uncultured Vibrio sp.]|uniref:alpha-1,2-fucosyltransferase n=1 Tax=uncultured Vibrio sp. TaxID=114054 RepID=UPI002AA91D9D|nr:alpha-1,2-fucosyltransferase [uncultured Vibrio sp.]
MKYPVIVRLQGGLGNQLYQYATGRAVAKRFGCPMFLDKRTIEPEAPARHYNLGVFNIQENFVKGYLAWMTRWVGSVRLGKYFTTFWLPARNFHYLRDSEMGYDSRLFEDHAGPIALLGYWQCYRHFDSISNELRGELTFKQGPVGKNRDMMDELQSCNSVGVHVRRGDYTNFTQSLGLCDAGYYQKATQHLQLQIENPKFYVFTDDPHWAHTDLNLGGAPFQVVDHNLGQADYEDMRLMSNCRHLIIANSSFSWWGAWLANHPGKIVIAPKNWFVHDEVPAEDRVPSAWLRM